MYFLDGFLPFGLVHSAQYFSFMAKFVIMTLFFENHELFLKNPKLVNIWNLRRKEFEKVMDFLLFPDLDVKVDSLLDDIWFIRDTSRGWKNVGSYSQIMSWNGSWAKT